MTGKFGQACHSSVTFKNVESSVSTGTGLESGKARKAEISVRTSSRTQTSSSPPRFYSNQFLLHSLNITKLEQNASVALKVSVVFGSLITV